MTNLEAALGYARRGWPVLPIRPDTKVPDGRLVPKTATAGGGLTQATTDSAVITDWWMRFPADSIAIATGAPGPDVLDVDDPDTADDRVWSTLEDVLQVQTRRGTHFYFSGTDERTIKLPYGELRRKGSYVMAPPSVHPDTGVAYAWVSEGAVVRPTPEWITEGRRTAGAGAAPDVDKVPPGAMYDHLLDLAVRLGRAAILDGPTRERILAAEFEARRIPGASYGGTPDDTRRLAYAPAEILEREAEKRKSSQLPSLEFEEKGGLVQVQHQDGEPAEELKVWTTEEVQTSEFKTDWLVRGVLAKQWAVLVTGREKTAGKGTFVTYLLSRIAAGGHTPWGDAVEPVTALVVSEEPGDTLQEKHKQFALADASVVFGRELARLHLDWPNTIALLVKIAEARGHGIIYLDNISRTARAENDDESGTGFARKVELLADAVKNAGMALIIDHHNRKSGGRTEDRFRGGTALPGAMDNHINIEHVGGWTDRRRKLSSRGRVRATIWEDVIELDAEGHEYSMVDTTPELGILTEREEWTVPALGASLVAAGLVDTIKTGAKHASELLKEYAAQTGQKDGSAPIWRVDHKAVAAADRDKPPV
jgi:hypothetical protein